MKQKITFFKVFLTLVLLCGVGNAWGETKTGTWDLTKSSSEWSATGNETYFSQPYGFKKVNGTLTNKNVADFSTSGITQIKVGFKCLQNGGSTSKITIYLVDKDGKVVGDGIEVIPVNKSAASQTAYCYATFDTNLANATGFMMKVTTFGKNILVNGAEYVVTYETSSVATPIIDPAGGPFLNSATATMSCATEGATIYYTTDESTPTNSSNKYTAPITVTESTIFKAIAYKDGEHSSVATAAYTKITPITSMDAVFEASGTADDYWITFDNWIVSAVKGDNAYLTDNNGKGLIIYKSGHGFAANDVLSGTVKCSLKKYNGSAEITSLTANSNNLTVTKAGTLNTIETTIANLGGVNTGAYVDLGTLTYNGTNFTDGTNTIKPYNAFITLPTLKNGVWYKVKGIYLQYNNDKEILPLTTGDFEEIPATTYEIDIDELTNGTITASTEKSVAGAEITLTITPNAHYALKDNSLCVLNETTSDEITVTNNKFTMPESNVLVSAEFVELPKHTVLYSVLGEDAGDEEVYAGETIANAPTPDGFDGWEFAGWTTDEDYAMSTTAPVLFTETTPVDDDYILYAVFKKSEGGSAPQYVKVTTALADWSGKYLIVFEGAEVNKAQVEPNAFDGSLDKLDVASNYVNVSIVDDAIAVDETNENAYFEISKIDGGYCITSQSGYSIGGTSNSNALNSSKTEQYLNTIALAAEGNAIITSNTSTLQFNATKDQTRFRYYKAGSTQKPVYLYKLEGGATTYYTTNKPQTQPVTISEACYATAFIPFAATVEGATAYYVTVSDDKAQLNEIEGTIPANTGVVLKGSAGTATFTESAVEPTTDVSENNMVGSLVGETFSNANFVYYRLANNNGNVGFYKQNADGWAECAAGKAVLAVPTGAGAPSFFTFDDATAINAISNVKTSSVRYNLNGQAVGEDYKGIVIVNGKKMFNK